MFLARRYNYQSTSKGLLWAVTESSELPDWCGAHRNNPGSHVGFQGDLRLTVIYIYRGYIITRWTLLKMSHLSVCKGCIFKRKWWIQKLDHLIFVWEYQDKWGGNTEQSFHLSNDVCEIPEQPDYNDELREPEKGCIHDLGWTQTPVTCPTLAIHSSHFLPPITVLNIDQEIRAG